MISVASLTLLVVSAYALPAERESTTTTDTCLASGETCLSFASGALGECCEGPSSCSEFVPEVGFACSTFVRSESTTTTTTTKY